MGNLLVSIITITYNSEKTLKYTIDSVLNQTYQNIEYIIIDGLSKDATIKIAKSYKKMFEEKKINYTIVSEKDSGIYDAMNKGIDLATGDIIGMINSDDWYESDAVEKVVNKYRETGFDLMYADLRLIKKSGTKIKKAKIRKYATSRDWNHPTMFVDRKVYKRFHYEVGKLYSDFDLWIKVRETDANIVVLNEVLANFRFGGASNEKNLKKVFNRIKERYSIYRKNGYSWYYIIECIFVEFLKVLIA